MDILGESFVAEDIQHWQGRSTTLDAPRIATIMGVHQLRTAPEAPERGSAGAGVPFFRFPQWLFCPAPDCRRMIRWSVTRERELEPGRPPRCTKCRSRRQLVPMRFVGICSNGHLDDVDWYRWAHSRARATQRCPQRDALEFRNEPSKGGGLDSLTVRCTACGAARSLSGISQPDALKSAGIRCAGRQPWLSRDVGESCELPLVAVQRGASNVHQPVPGSALDIPPDSDWDHYGGVAARIRSHTDFHSLEANPEHPLKDPLIANIAHEVGAEVPMVEAVLRAQVGVDDAVPVSGLELSEEQIRRDEWGALTARRSHTVDPRDRFVIEPVDLHEAGGPDRLPDATVELVDSLGAVIKVSRLREIRVLKGFQRYERRRVVPADLGARLGWLPAIEVYGEGIFLSLAEDRVAEWERHPDVLARTAALEQRRRTSYFAELLPQASPRFVLVHTLAHLLVRELVYESGYSSSSLRERLYVGQADSPRPMAGLLVYTGAGDSEGTLGGLVRGGELNRLLPTMATALLRSEWCSLDPVCAETTAQGPDGLSLAACHACALVAETSCERGNALLDRKLLVDSGFGYFRTALTAAQRRQAAEVL